MCQEIRAMKASLQVLMLTVVAVLVTFAAAQTPAKPVSEQDVVSMLGLGLDAEAIVARMKKGGIAFEPNDAALAKLKAAGAADAVLTAVKAEGAKGKPVAPAAGAVTFEQVLQ